MTGDSSQDQEEASPISRERTAKPRWVSNMSYPLSGFVCHPSCRMPFLSYIVSLLFGILLFSVHSLCLNPIAREHLWLVPALFNSQYPHLTCQCHMSLSGIGRWQLSSFISWSVNFPSVFGLLSILTLHHPLCSCCLCCAASAVHSLQDLSVQ